MTLTALALLASTIVIPVRFGPASVESLHCTGIVRAESQDGRAAVVASTLDSRESARLELPYPGRWLVSLSSETCWAAPVVFAADPATARDVEFQRWPKGLITGSLLVTSRQQAPRTIQMELRPAVSRGRPEGGDPLATVSCPVTDGQWKCDAPLTALDIRVGAEGFAPAYFWNVQFDNGRADMHSISLRPGASLVGWVEDVNGEPVAGAEVQMAPQHVSRQAARISGQAAQTRKVVSNERGFFQFQEIGSGDFTIAARTNARAVAAPRHVSIRDGEQRLPDPIILEHPASMLVQIDPPLSPDRQPWNVRLSRLMVADSTRELTASGRASDLGTWSAEKVERGPHYVEILDPTGSVVAQLDADIDRETMIVNVEIGKIRVEGRVRFGTEPIASELKFSSAHGNVRMTSGDDGTFRAWLPKDGSWNVQITPKDALQRVRTRVDVRVPPDATHATLNIDLPAGRIEGIVVDEDGKPVPETEILVLSGNEVLANAGTDHDGRFLIAGLESGPVVLQAKKRSLSSEYHRCTVTAEAVSKETLVLRAPAEWKGRLIHPSGGAVVGALIRYFDGDELLTTISGPTGEFSLTLSSGIRFTDIVVIAPRLPVFIDRVQSMRDEKILILPDVAAVIQVAPPRTGRLPGIGRAGTRIIPISMLFAPRQGFGPPPEASNGAFELRLAPGQYNVCYSPAGDCIQVAAQGGVITRVNPRKAEGGP